MKETVSTMTLFKIIIVFTFLFAAFLSVAILYNRVYRLKNQTTSILEKYEGFNNNSAEIINSYLKNSGYNTTGRCEADEFGVPSLDFTSIEPVVSGKRYFYCLSYYCKDGTGCDINSKNNKIFFKVKLFFKFELPYFGELFTFKITGDTKEIIYYNENQKLS